MFWVVQRDTKIPFLPRARYLCFRSAPPYQARRITDVYAIGLCGALEHRACTSNPAVSNSSAADYLCPISEPDVIANLNRLLSDPLQCNRTCQIIKIVIEGHDHRMCRDSDIVADGCTASTINDGIRIHRNISSDNDLALLRVNNRATVNTNPLTKPDFTFSDGSNRQNRDTGARTY